METQDSKIGPNFVLGLIIVAVGAVLLLGRLGYIESVNLFAFWPLVLVAVGLSRLFRSTSRGSQLVGTVFTIGGLVMLAHNFGYVRLNWSLLWPVALILFGVSLLFRSLSRPRVVDDPTSSPTVLNEWVMFGGSKAVITSKIAILRGGARLPVSRGGYAKLSALLGNV